MADMDGDVPVALPESAKPAIPELDRTASRLTALVRRIGRAECALVARIAAPARVGALRHCAIYLNKLGNGWLYALMTLLVLGSGNSRRWYVVLSAVLAAGCAHAVYRLLKRRVRRPRPFDADDSLTSLAPPLDQYSFPSGHCMTFAAVLVPVRLAFPSMFAPLVGTWLLIAWARLASAHHYPSDVLAGTALGVVAAWPISVLMLN